MSIPLILPILFVVLSHHSALANTDGKQLGITINLNNKNLPNGVLQSTPAQLPARTQTQSDPASYGSTDLQMHKLFESIRHSRGYLSAFFKQFPKGSELHYHYSGGLPTEVLIQASVDANLLLCNTTWKVERPSPPPQDACAWTPMQWYAQDPNTFRQARMQLLEEWSIYNYQQQEYETPAEHFFKTFGKFSAAKDVDKRRLLQVTKDTARADNIAYMEIMLDGPKGPKLNVSLEAELLKVGATKDLERAMELMDKVYNSQSSNTWNEYATEYVKYVEEVGGGFDDDSYTVRYLAYATRIMPPLTVFSSLGVSFLANEKSDLIVGVNLVGSEIDYVSLRDYWLHMVMVRYLRLKFPAVRVALHAGELTTDMVAPDDQRRHVQQAVRLAMAHRIGHGVGLPEEDDSAGTLQLMKDKNVALELLLTSNEFILPQSEGDRHSLPMYFDAGVPITVSSDDPGILRTTLTEQYVELAYKYPQIKYGDIRKMALNGIEYSFIKDMQTKGRLYSAVQQDIAAFEAKVLAGKTQLHRKMRP